MLFGIFSRCDSMGEVCDGTRALGGKLNYLGMDSSPAKSTVGDALRDRDEELFRLFYFALITHFSLFLSVSRKKKYRKQGVSFENFYAFDSTTVTLFSDVMKGVGRNPKGDGKKKGGLKVHMLTDVHADTLLIVTISKVKKHDKNFFQYLKLSAGCMVVFYKDEEERKYKSITNNWEIMDGEIAKMNFYLHTLQELSKNYMDLEGLIPILCRNSSI